MSATAIETADSPDLEELFDSIALAPPPAAAPATAPAPVAAAPIAAQPAATLAPAKAEAPTPAPAPTATAAPGVVATAPESALVSTETAAVGTVTADSVEDNAPVSAGATVINSVGQLTRQLHNTLAELGLDRSLQDATAAALPDARQRIAYVVKLTEDAASKCLSAVECATPLQEGLAADAAALAGKWDNIFAGKSDVSEFKTLAQSTRDYLNEVSARTDETRGHLREVMMAQEFQDLTGQVLKKISELATTLESQLLMLLVENSPSPLKPEAVSLLNGPAIDGSAPNVVASQAQVDELLESLGF